jgi:acyl-CoA oxidase
MASVDLLLGEPRLEPFLPLLHAAWADGDLTPAEIETLRGRLVALVDGDCVPAVEDWLRPDSPPPATELARLAHQIRLGLPGMVGRAGPTELGLRLAGSVPDSVIEDLRAVEESVGPFGPAAARELVTRADTPGLIEPMPAPTAPGFDLDVLRDLLDGPHAAVKEQVRDILSRPEFAHRAGLPVDDQRARIRSWLEVLAAEEIGSLGFPAELGGGGDPGGFLAAFATIGHHDLSLLTKFGVQFGLFAGSVLRLGTGQHHEVLRPAIAGDLWGCFAMTETGHGSNVADLRTTATYRAGDEEFEIHTPHPRARKDYIGNAAIDGQVAVVFARLVVDELDHGIHAFLVPIRDNGTVAAGVTIGDDGAKAGLNGVDNGWISFDRVRVPRTALLDRFARVGPDGTYESEITSPTRRFFTTVGTLVGGRVSVAAAAVSAAETALAIAVRYAHRRRQFSTDGGIETRLIDYRSHQRRLMPRLAAAYAYHFAAADLAARYVRLETAPGDTGHDRRAFEGRTAGLKAFSTWQALDTVLECRQACGGQGYMADNRLGPLAADVDVFTTFEGDNTVLAQLLAKAMLTDYRSSFDDLTPGRLVRFFADRVGDFITESVPVLGSVGGEVTDPDTCHELLQRRARFLLAKLAERVKRRIDDGAEAADAFLDVQPHAVQAARAATELEVFEAIQAMSAGEEVPGVLEDLAVLFALWRVEVDLGGYLIGGLLTPAGAKEVRAAVDALSARVAERSLHLVDAFTIPALVLGAPIAR